MLNTVTGTPSNCEGFVRKQVQSEKPHEGKDFWMGLKRFG